MLDAPVDDRLIRRCWSHNGWHSLLNTTLTLSNVFHANIRTLTRRWRRPSGFPKMVIVSCREAVGDIDIIHLVLNALDVRNCLWTAGHLSETIAHRGSDVFDAIYNTHHDLWMLNDIRHVEFLCRVVGLFCVGKCVYTPHLGFANRCRKLSFWTEINKKDA